MLTISTATMAAPAAVAQEDGAGISETVQTLENGEELYLVFGADLDEGMTLDEYIEDEVLAGPGEASSDVIQYQDVDQVNVNVQEEAASISIDGGEATAVQESNQLNDNEQVADAAAQNQAIEAVEADFENVGTVYLVIGNGDDQRFNGWGVADDKKSKTDVAQSATAAVTQYQEVEQVNVNEQSTALAIAEDESEAVALQSSEQLNENLQDGGANASNVYTAKEKSDTDRPDGQLAEAAITQDQTADQTNTNEQGAAVAIAVGQNSTATAIQVSDQTNINEQLATAQAENVFASMDGMAIATAGTPAGSDVVTSSASEDYQQELEDPHEKKDDKPDQQADASVTQYQDVEQVNVNVQSMAVAIATDGSEASAVQFSQQENYNAQVGYAGATNVYVEGDDAYEGAVFTENTTVTVGGNQVASNPYLSFDYDGNASQELDVEQEANAIVEQVQVTSQLNLNEQHAAVAIADNGGDAGAVQVSMQTNENVQFAFSDATSVIAC